MTEFTQLIKSGNTQKAYSQRQAILKEINLNVTLIKDLDRDSPIAMTFTRFETNVNESLIKLKSANFDLNTNLTKSNPDIDNDASYKSDQKSIRDQVFLACNTVEDYIELLNSKGIPYPPDVKPESSSGDLAAILTSQEKILNNLVTSQDKNAAAHADLSKTLVNQLKSHASSRLGPKATQPKFKPKGNDSDYGEFKDFLRKFEFFTAKCSSTE